MANFTTLREANVARGIEWTGGNEILDITWRGCELGGEVGEIADELERRDVWERRHILAEELADGVICIDLAGMTLGLDPIPIFARGSIPVTGLRAEANDLRARVCRMQNAFKKLERERRGWPGSRSSKSDVDFDLHSLMGRIGLIATYCKVDLIYSTAAKFNATSHKVGLVTRLLHGGEVVSF